MANNKKVINIEIKTDGSCGPYAAIMIGLWEVAYHMFAKDFKENKTYKKTTLLSETSGAEYVKFSIKDFKK